MLFSLRGGRFCGAVLLLVSLVAGGCGPRTGTVTGKVTYQNTALRGGNVTFIGANGRSATAPIGEDGRYTAERVPVGEVKITVETKSLAKQATLPKYKAPPGAGGDYKPPDLSEAKKRYVAIPHHYADPATSGLTFTVKGGSQEHDLPLTGAITAPPPGSEDPGGYKGSKGSKGGPPR